MENVVDNSVFFYNTESMLTIFVSRTIVEKSHLLGQLHRGKMASQSTKELLDDKFIKIVKHNLSIDLQQMHRVSVREGTVS